MRLTALPLLAMSLVFSSASVQAQDMHSNRRAARQAVAGPEDRISREVRHELVMLPRYDVFDNLEYRVNGGTVTLLGQVTLPVVKSDAEGVVKQIEGVTQVNNQIEVLPPSSMDDRIRLAEYRAIYSEPSLSKYSLQAVPPIHIIVKNGHVDLEGVVDNETDKNLAGIRAKGVPGTFEIQNNLRVEGTR